MKTQTKQITIYPSEALYKKLLNQCVKEKRSFSNYIILLLEKELKL